MEPLERRVDVLVVGGGNAGMCAALEASKAGARVLVCEKGMPVYRGGNSRHTRDIRYRHEAPDEYTTGRYSADDFRADIERVSAGLDYDRELAALLVEESASLPRWMTANGVRWQASLRGTLNLHASNAFFMGGGRAMLNAYYAAAERRDVEVWYEAEVLDLAVENGSFRHALVALPGGRSATVEAAAVVVCSGGFEANRDWLRECIGSAADGVIVRGTPNNDGRLLRLLLDHGAAPVGDATSFHAIAVDARSPRYDGGIVTRVDSVPFGVVVNHDGRRFADEGADLWPKRYATWGGLIASQPDQLAYSITDAKAEGRFIPVAFPPRRALTLQALIEDAGLPVAATLGTVRDFNAGVRSDGPLDLNRLDGNHTEGIDPPKSHWAAAIDTPPFSLYPLRPGITFTYLGMRVDAAAHVVAEDGTAWQNIYAAGEVMAGNILGRGYLAGMGLTIGHVFGRIAGREAARDR